MSEPHPTDLLPGYALGCLDRDEQSEVREHLLDCAACRTELRALEEVAANLAYAVPSAEPSASLKWRLLAACHPLRSYPWFDALFRRWPRLVPVTALFACLLVIVLGSTSYLLWQQDRVPGMLFVALQGTENQPAATGRLVIDSGSGRGLLLVSDLPPLPQDEQYQLWLIKDGQRTSGAVFSVLVEGMADVQVISERPLASYDSFGITIEPFGGSPGPTGRKVLGGKMVL